MSSTWRILAVDDTPHNVKLLVDLLSAKGYEVDSAASGAEALARLESEPPDLILLDVVMPEMSGYEVCRAIRKSEKHRLLPVVMVTALDPKEERVKGIEAGADDFLSKPINQAELLARVRSLLRIRALRLEIEEWNATLEQRVADQVQKLSGLERLRGFFSPQVAELIEGSEEAALMPHRRRVSVVFIDLRGFTQFSEVSEPEEVMEVLGEYHEKIGYIVTKFEGTLERFTGDGMMIFFNDPVEIPNHELRAVQMAVAMRDAVAELEPKWTSRGFELGAGIGIETGYATLGVIGFEGRQDYAAIGNVTNLASRLCGLADNHQILVSERLYSSVKADVEAESAGSVELKGFSRAVSTFSILGLNDASAS
jgi:adenylate cyclase